MAYRADFYRPENIIGYTGNLDIDPTVYFLTGPDHGPNEYGHITQAHPLDANVGRESVRRSAQYEMRVGANGALEEWDAGRRVHPSRHPFVPIAGLSARGRYQLACSIARFTELKSLAQFSGHQRRDLIRYGRVRTF